MIDDVFKKAFEWRAKSDREAGWSAGVVCRMPERLRDYLEKYLSNGVNGTEFEVAWNNFLRELLVILEVHFPEAIPEFKRYWGL